MNRLKELREAAGMTQTDLCVATGISPSGISRLETNESPNPEIGTARKLADALGCGIDDLFPAAAAAGSGRKSGRRG